MGRYTSSVTCETEEHQRIFGCTDDENTSSMSESDSDSSTMLKLGGGMFLPYWDTSRIICDTEQVMHTCTLTTVRSVSMFSLCDLRSNSSLIRAVSSNSWITSSNFRFSCRFSSCATQRWFSFCCRGYGDHLQFQNGFLHIGLHGFKESCTKRSVTENK